MTCVKGATAISSSERLNEEMAMSDLTDIEKWNELSRTAKSLVAEQGRLNKFNCVASDMENVTPKRRGNAREDAREAAVEIRRLRHEAHCLAVELGIADRRADSHYQDSVAPAGFGNYRKFEKREPSVVR